MILYMTILETRTRKLNQNNPKEGPIVYWMNRDMRINDNWALLYAQQLADQYHQPLVIVFSLFRSFETAKNTPEDKMFYRLKQGLRKVKEDAKTYNLPFLMLEGDTVATLSQFLESIKAGTCVTDFSPLKAMRRLREELAYATKIPLIEVDAHNIVPVWVASDKQEWGAYTLRPKIHRILPTYLIPFPKVKPQHLPFHYDGKTILSWLDGDVLPLHVNEDLERFLTVRLPNYHLRNDPNIQGTSGLSSYFHFGHLASQTVALQVQASSFEKESFLEELIVRKEIADNFCFYNPNYDTFEGFPDWAKKTLNAHRADPREFIYDYDSFARGLTHDEAWNACQLQLVKTGYMHGYMRMYWAKKILEWTTSPEEALMVANTLNDTYQLDGRDPNGYTGTAWAIGGVHDRPWQERSIFGMIRYMNAAGLKRKFDIGAYIRTWTGGGLF
jgi:deoxyribodipyrimidine photo-lyase